MQKDIRDRTYIFGIRIINFCRKLPSDRVSGAICSQLVRSGTSIGANTEEAQDAMSRADFVKTLSIALKEARETYYWLRILRDAKMVTGSEIEDLIDESGQLVRILVKIVKTTKGNTDSLK